MMGKSAEKTDEKIQTTLFLFLSRIYRLFFALLGRRYDFQDALRKWQGLHQVMVQQQRPGSPEKGSPSLGSPTRAESIQSTGEKLVDHAMRLLTGQWLQVTEEDASAGAGASAAIRLTCQPVYKPAGQEGAGFSPEGGPAAGTFSPEALEAALNGALQQQQYVARVAALADADRVEVSLQKAAGLAPTALQEEREAVAFAVGWAIKGNLSEALQGVGLNVQHLDCGESPAMCRLICRQVCMSKLVLQVRFPPLPSPLSPLRFSI